MPTLADIYSAADSFKRRLADAASNPGDALSQMLGYANDRARGLNEQIGQAASQPEFISPQDRQMAAQLAESYSPVGMVNVPIKGAKLVHIPVDMIEHGEAATPGGTLSFPGAAKKIQDYATRETSIPPIEIVSPEGGSGKWMVVDGSHRLEAAKLKGQSTIPAYVSPHDKEGLDLIRKMKMNAIDTNGEKMRTFKTADGYTFYELPNGKIVDNLDPEGVDMSWDSFKQLKDDFGDDVYQVEDELGKRRAEISSTGQPNILENFYDFMAKPEPDQLYQQAVNKQNAQIKPNLKLVKK